MPDNSMSTRTARRAGWIQEAARKIECQLARGDFRAAIETIRQAYRDQTPLTYTPDEWRRQTLANVAGLPIHIANRLEAHGIENVAELENHLKNLDERRNPVAMLRGLSFATYHQIRNAMAEIGIDTRPPLYSLDTTTTKTKPRKKPASLC